MHVFQDSLMVFIWNRNHL